MVSSCAYVGETGRYCGQRKKEHMADLKLGNISKSAVAEHAIINDHRIDRDQCCVLVKEKDQHKRKKLELWKIHKLATSINRDKGNLSELFVPLARKDQRNSTLGGANIYENRKC